MKPFNIFGKYFIYFLVWRFSFIIGGIFLVFCIMACSDNVNFMSLSHFNCGEAGDMEGFSCEEEDDDDKRAGAGDEEKGGALVYLDDDESGFIQINIELARAKLGKINVLFVVDNSPSMEEEQRVIAHQFDDFLEDIKHMDYRIGIITTDVDDGEGRLLVFSNNEKFLSNPGDDRSMHNENVGLFQERVQLGDKGSTKERGIYTLNLALDEAGNADFFRPYSLLMVIVVSDENEDKLLGSVDGYIEKYSEPETFFKRFSQKHRFSAVTVHSIIVKPDDSGCKSRSGGGTYGYVYNEASNPSDEILEKYGNIRKGHMGSICSTNYSSQLGSIADTVVDVPVVTLPCFPKSDSVSVKVNDEEVEFRIEERQVIIEERVTFASAAKASVRFLCRE